MHIGDLAPDFTLADQHGEPRTLSTLLGQGPVTLFFYPAAMTTGCTKESCHFRDLGAEFRALGAQRIGISTSKNRLDYPLLCDVEGRVARQYGVKRALGLLKVKRTTFVIAQGRRIVDIITSELNMNAHADRSLAALATLSS
jgi:peroxiredoxin Q/BCP